MILWNDMSMNSADLLSNIKKTEDQAQSILDGSQARAKLRLDECAAEAVRMVNAAGEDSHKEAAIRISNAKRDIEHEIAALIAKGDADISAAVNASHSNRDAALALVLSKFKEAGSE